MKYKYCQNCKKAYVRSRLEKDNCIYCNDTCETVDVKKNGLYYYGYAVMVLGAGSVLVPKLAEVSGPSNYLVMGIVLVVVGTVFVMMGSVRMAKDAAAEASAKMKANSEDSE